MIGEDDLQAFIDGRLDGARRAEVEAHLAAHPEVGERVAAERRHRTMLRDELKAKFDEPIPARLGIAALRAARRGGWASRMRMAAAALAIFVVGAAGGWLANDLMPDGVPAAPTRSVAQGAAAAYRTLSLIHI